MGAIKVIKGSYGYYAELQHRAQLDDPAAVDANKECWLHVGFQDEDVVLPLVNFRPLSFKDINGRMLSAYFNNRNTIMTVAAAVHPTEEITVFEVDKDSKFWSVVFSKHTR